MGSASVLHLVDIYNVANHRMNNCPSHKQNFYRKVINKAMFRLERAGIEIKKLNNDFTKNSSIKEVTLKKFLIT